MERNTLLVNLLVGSVMFAVYELLGFESTVVLGLVLLIMAAGEIANQMQSDGPLTADDLE